MVPRVVLACLLALPAAAAWTEYNIGPFHVLSDAGDREARQRLTEMEQLRYVLGSEIGKKDLQTVWPIELVLFSNQREYAPHALPQPFLDGGSATLSAWPADKPLPNDFRRALARILLEDNAGRMPEAIETALSDLFSTLQVNATKVSLGAPPAPGELPADRMAAWAMIQMLATQPDYAGLLHVYLNNLQQGAGDAIALQNAFNITPAGLNARVDAYLAAGKFAAAPVNGEAIAPAHDFIERAVPQAAINDVLAELHNRGQQFPPESPRGLVAKNTRPALELAAKANPRWAEPHVRLAALATDPAEKIKELKIAALLEPRNSELWQELARQQTTAEQYADAEKSWYSAERNARNDAERARIRKIRADLAEQRAAFEIAEKQRLAAERAAQLQRIKDQAAAEVHAAEAAANARLGGLKPGEKPVPWWTDPAGPKVSGKLTRVDCLPGTLRLTVQPAAGLAVKLLIRDPNQLTVKGQTQAEFACGVQRTPRNINLVHNGKPDERLGTSGDVLTVEFP